MEDGRQSRWNIIICREFFNHFTESNVQNLTVAFQKLFLSRIDFSKAFQKIFVANSLQILNKKKKFVANSFLIKIGYGLGHNFLLLFFLKKSLAYVSWKNKLGNTYMNKSQNRAGKEAKQGHLKLKVTKKLAAQ